MVLQHNHYDPSHSGQWPPVFLLTSLHLCSPVLATSAEPARWTAEARLHVLQLRHHQLLGLFRRGTDLVQLLEPSKASVCGAEPRALEALGGKGTASVGAAWLELIHGSTWICRWNGKTTRLI